MTVNDMRLYLLEQYPNSKTWRHRVANMKTNQVIAIYKDMEQRNYRKAQEAKAEPKQEAEYHQMDIYEYQLLLANEKGLKGSHTEVKV